MEKKESHDSEEKASALLAKQLGILPAEIESMQKLLKATREILHYYINEFGLHLEKEQQAELARLSSKSDVLVLKTSRLSFEINSLESEAKKSIETKKEFTPEKRLAGELAKKTSETKKELLELNERVTSIVEKMKEPEKEK